MFGAYGYKNTLVGNIASSLAKQKAKQTKKVIRNEGGKIGKKYKNWSNTNEGKLITGAVGGYMRNRGKINKALNSFKFAVE
jgi:hypothetical protein|tara:strand:+ start:140 stop:382 length:243 start_codon:yes stop_codon:yes gene_type:complete